jgi:type I restriction enzyme, S subunit
MMELKIDRTNWKKVKLGDVAFEYSKRITNPSESEFDRFVGSSNIDQWDFRVKSWEATDSVTSAMKLFEPNDYLLVRRSLYASDFRERAPRAHFHGVCSGDILTIKENPDEVIDGFLIGVFNSPALWSYVVANASGSITRRIKWRDLANYEFLLPPKDQQAQLAELLWAMDEVIEREREVLEKTQINIEVQSSHLIWNSNHKLEPLVSFSTSDLKKLVDGDWIESKDQSEEGIRLLQLADIGVREFINKSARFISEETFKRLRCFEVLPNDVLIARMPDPIGRACIIPETGEKMITAVDCCIARVNQDHSSNKYLMYLLNTREFLHNANLLASGTTRQRIARKTMEQMKVPKPILPVQQDIVKRLDTLITIKKSADLKISSSQSLQKSLINQIF